MARHKRSRAGAVAPSIIEDALVEQRFVVMTQSEIQRIVNKKGLSNRELSYKLGVSEARVSQMFSAAAGNLTIKTIARIFHKLGEEAMISSRSGIAALLENTSPDDINNDWILHLPPAYFQADFGEIVEDKEDNELGDNEDPKDWARVDPHSDPFDLAA
jgi:DNA-binding Xre family transcriptional regulator